MNGISIACWIEDAILPAYREAEHTMPYHTTAAFSVNGFDFILYSLVTKLLTLVLARRSLTQMHTCAHTQTHRIPFAHVLNIFRLFIYYVGIPKRHVIVHSIHAAVIDIHATFAGGSVRITLLRNIQFNSRVFVQNVHINRFNKIHRVFMLCHAIPQYNIQNNKLCVEKIAHAANTFSSSFTAISALPIDVQIPHHHHHHRRHHNGAFNMAIIPSDLTIS